VQAIRSTSTGRGEVSIHLRLFEDFCNASSYHRHYLDELCQTTRFTQLSYSLPFRVIAVLQAAGCVASNGLDMCSWTYREPRVAIGGRDGKTLKPPYGRAFAYSAPVGPNISETGAPPQAPNFEVIRPGGLEAGNLEIGVHAL
jgi:hypothetical protein